MLGRRTPGSGRTVPGESLTQVFAISQWVNLPPLIGKLPQHRQVRFVHTLLFSILVSGAG
jgi:hypothetical protein